MPIDIKGCDSNFQVKYSNFKTHWKWNIYLASNNMYLDSTWNLQ